MSNKFGAKRDITDLRHVHYVCEFVPYPRKDGSFQWHRGREAETVILRKCGEIGDRKPHCYRLIAPDLSHEWFGKS